MIGNVLERHLGTLIKYLHMDEIRPVLRRYGVLLPEELEELIDDISSRPKSHAIEKLVTRLGYKGPTGLYYFKKALEETPEAMGHQDILKELSEDPDFEAIISDCQEK